ncbi:MAG: hypothetical protein KAQ75_02410 [Bacteroidales bacterium]|nr:hypothetical protein [Bacteroidales bacterium]
MMKKLVIYILLFGIIGLIIGYLLFGKIGGDYINVKVIFNSSKNAIESFSRNISGLAKIKQNILISGGIGAVLGLVITFIRKK